MILKKYIVILVCILASIFSGCGYRNDNMEVQNGSLGKSAAGDIGKDNKNGIENSVGGNSNKNNRTVTEKKGSNGGDNQDDYLPK